MMYVKLAYEGQGGRWFGDLVAKSCSTPVTPWTVARQAPLSMGIPPVFLLGEFMNRGARQATDHGLTKSQTQLST